MWLKGLDTVALMDEAVLTDLMRSLRKLNMISLDEYIPERVPIPALNAMATCTSLSRLCLTCCTLPSGAFVALSRIHTLEQLRLGWTDDYTDDAAVQHLLQLPVLRALELRCTAITDASLVAIAAHVTSLRMLCLSDCKLITLEGLQKLVFARPALHIECEQVDERDSDTVVAWADAVRSCPHPPTALAGAFSFGYDLDELPTLDDLHAARLDP
jgi:hypothetical protein